MTNINCTIVYIHGGNTIITCRNMFMRTRKRSGNPALVWTTTRMLLTIEYHYRCPTGTFASKKTLTWAEQDSYTVLIAVAELAYADGCQPSGSKARAGSSPVGEKINGNLTSLGKVS